MDFWAEILPIVVYAFLIIFLIVGIILGIRTIIVMNKVEKIIDDVNEKIETLNPLFNIVDFAVDRVSSLSDTLVDFFAGILSGFLTKKDKKTDNKKGEDNE